MKKFLFMLLWHCLHISLCAQSIDTSTYRGKMDYLLQPLDSSLVTTGILYDRVEPWADLRDFGHRGYTDTSGLLHYWQARFEMIGASYSAGPTDSLALKTLVQQNTGLVQRNVIPIGGLLCQFQVLDTNAVNNGTLSLQHDRLQLDESKASESYLLIHQSFVAALLAGQVKTGSYWLKADPAYWYCNTGQSVAQWAVYENGTLVDSLNPGDSIAISLAAPGLHTFVLVARTASGQSYTTYSTFSVQGAAVFEHEWNRPDNDPYWGQTFPSCNNSEPTPISAVINFRGYTMSEPPLLGQAEYSIYKRYSDQQNCGLQTVRQPIIILDGFDPADERKAECLYGKYLRYLENPSDFSSNKHLGNVVRNNPNQYDVIVLNFKDWTTPNGTVIHGGADYIERNAMVLVELIKQVNAALAANGSTEKLVIIGPSMGGLISRYALAYMEKKQAEQPTDLTWDHRCRIWISFDSPHQGANIAIGVQQFLKFFGENDVAEAQAAIDKELGSTAAKQMLLIHHLAGESVVGPAPLFRTTFVNNLINNGLDGSLGWPQNCRRIALINGSLSGSLFAQNCAEGTKVEAFLQYKAWRFFNWVYRTVFGSVRAAYGKTYMIGGNSGCTVFEGNKFMGSPANRVVSLSVGNSTVGLDAAPGGSFAIFGEINGSGTTPTHSPLELFNFKPALVGIAASINLGAGAILATVASATETPWNTIGGHSFGLGTRMKFTTVNWDASFIPTKSALGFHWKTGTIGDWGENLRNRQLYCSGEIPFHAYFGEDHNSEHVSLSNAKVGWVLNQLNISEFPTQDPNISISGTSAMALGSTHSFSASFLPIGNSTGFLWEILDIHGGVQPQMVGSASAPNMEIHLLGGTSTTGEGDFSVRLTSWYTNSAGEVVCYGVKTRKVKTFKHLSLGFTPLCNLIKQNCSVKLSGIKPSGVTYLSSDWEISKFSNSDWSPVQAHEGYITLSNWAGAPSNQVGKYLNFPLPMAGGNQFMLYIRIRTHLQVANPNFGIIPGDPQFVDYAGPWKYYSHLYKVQNTVGCPGCTGALVFSPNPAIKGTDAQVEVEVTDPEITYPTHGYIKDRRGLVISQFEVAQPNFSLPITALQPAAYAIGIEGGHKNVEDVLIVTRTENDRILVSPNPLFKEVDHYAAIKIMDGQSEDSGFEVTLDDMDGLRLLSFTTESKTFDLDVRDLPTGSYILTATGANGSFHENLELTLQSEPYLWVSPNPAGDQITANIYNPITPEPALQIVVTDKFGIEQFRLSATQNTCTVDVSTLLPDLYFIHVMDGVKQYSRVFTKL